MTLTDNFTAVEYANVHSMGTQCFTDHFTDVDLLELNVFD